MQNSSSTVSSPTISAECRIAVVIVNYNVKDFLAQCLASLNAALVGIPSHIIVVDNDSTDGSMDYVEALFPEVECVRLPENIGFGRANNLGFEKALARGAHYVLCLNPDTLVSEDTMSIMLEYMEQHTDVGLAGCKLLNADGTFQLACRRGFPTPWASFCKVFGLQTLFPRSELFARYNQTFRDENATYTVDAVCGAFMVIRRETLERIRGFDEEFFMYGEDLDICYRVQREGWSVAYVHSTSVIHYKGESTRRSSLNEVRVFYEAMEIFARKHFGSSRVFLWFLRTGIWFRALLAFGAHYWREGVLALWDAGTINAALLVATYLRFSEWFHFPVHAYPTVFVVITSVTIGALFMAGEYSPYQKPSVRRVFSACMTSFFILSALPYFFKNYAFSRTVSILMFVFGFVGMAFGRVLLRVAERTREQSARRVLFVGANAITERIIGLLSSSILPHQSKIMDETIVDMTSFRPPTRPTIIGVVPVGCEVQQHSGQATMLGVPIVGEASYLRRMIEQTAASEVIITDTTTPRAEMIRLIMDAAAMPASQRATFRFAREYDDVIATQIAEDYAGVSSLTQYNLALWQYRFAKRIIDVVGAIFLLSIASTVVIFGSRKRHFFHKETVDNFFAVLRGEKSIVGLYSTPSKATDSAEAESQQHISTKRTLLGKIGLTGLAHINSPERLSSHAIHSLNEFYTQRYSLWLDVEIIIAYCSRWLFTKRRTERPEQTTKTY